ncbi:hypothetical protein G9A89_019341 [Geosiphon pyriformis]|nr:hypothetical protein G9A89_019341 [Geosiphon pyriformis]
MSLILDWEKKDKRKGKKKEKTIPKKTNDTTITSKLRLYQMKITGHKSITIASLVTANAMAIKKNKASGTINYALLIVNNCLMKECKMTFLVEKECVTLYVNTRSLLAIG